MLQAALELEVDEHIELGLGIAAAAGRQVVVRNGSHPQRELVGGIGRPTIRQPRVQDRREGTTSPMLHRVGPDLTVPFLWPTEGSVSDDDFREDHQEQAGGANLCHH